MYSFNSVFMRAARAWTAPHRTSSIASRLGQHSDAVLAEAGYTPDEIDAFRRAGVLG